MRIAYICGTKSWGGLEMNQAKNALWMKNRGHSVLALGIEASKFHQFCGDHEIPFHPIQPHKKYYDFNASKTLRKVLNQHQINHLILRDVRDMSVSVAAKFWGKSTFKVHYFMEMQLGVSKKNLFHTLRFQLLDTWSCPLAWLKQQVEEKTRMNPAKIVVIPSALDLSPFQNQMEQSTARNLLNIPYTHPLLGLAGRFDTQKGQLLLLEALTKIEDQNVGIVFLGEPTMNEGDAYSQAMQKLIAADQLEKRVFIRPFRADIQVFYKAIDAFIMASKAETVGMVTLEAMASGTPVIGSKAGGTIELLQNGKLGYLFETLNSDALAAQISSFLQAKNRPTPAELQAGVAKFDQIKVLELVENRLMKA
jgi:glycosyltransferase involved in cell wall biosynthesis